PSSNAIDLSYEDIELRRYNNNPIVFDKNLLQKIINIFRRINDKICIETNIYTDPLKISCDNDILTINYWLVPRIPHDYNPKPAEEIKEIKAESEISEEFKIGVGHEIFHEEREEDIREFEDDRRLDPPEQKDDWEPVKRELED
ncbi:unnamed protein product, partial [marine sediment metagenome]